MSSSTSAMQLLGGLLSLSPGVNTAMPMQSGAAPAAMPAGDPGGFYALWMGMAAQGQMMSSADGLARQDLVMDAAGHGIKLPPETAEQLLQKLDQLLQQASNDDTELIESAVELLRLGLQQAEPNQGMVSGEADALADPDMSDADLLEYLKALLESPPGASEAGLATSNEDPLHLSEGAKHTLINYLEQKLAAPDELPSSTQPVLPETLSTEEMAEAERLVRQLWVELESARQVRAELQAEAESAEGKAGASDGTYAAQATDQVQKAAVTAAHQPSTNGLSGMDTPVEDQDSEHAEVNKAAAAAAAMNSQSVNSQAQSVQQLAAERQAADAGDKVDRMPLTPERPGGQREADKERDRRAELAAGTVREPFMPNRPVAEATRAERIPVISDVTMAEGRPVSVEQVVSDRLRAALTDERSTAVAARTETSQAQSAEALRMTMPGQQTVQAPILQAQNSQDALMQKMLNPAWSKALGERAVMMAQQGPRVAEVRLDPPELGSLRIRVQIHGSDQVSLSFNAPNAAVREVLEQSMPRLREMFAEQGLNLSDTSVGDQSTQDRADKEKRDAGAKGFAGGVGDDLGDVPSSRVGARKIGLIDYYA